MRYHVVYCRVSSKVQSKEDRFSLPDQEAFGRKFFESKGVRDVEVIRDQYTGNSTLEERPGGKRLAELIKGGEVESLYVKVSDRLFRNSGKAISFIDVLVDKGIQVYVDGIPRDFKRSDDKLLFSIEAVVAAHERDSIIRRTTAGRKHSRDAGKSFSPDIYGYKKTYTAKGKIEMVVDPVEGPVIQRVFAMRAGGATLGQIMKELNSSGIPTKKGHIWFEPVVRAMLKNSAYIAVVKDSEGNPVPSVVYPPLVDKAIWAAAQRGDRSEIAANYFKRSAQPLSGILRCSICNAPFNYKKSQDRNGVWAYSAYYHNRSVRSEVCWPPWSRPLLLLFKL